MSRFHKRDGGNLVKIPIRVVRCSRDETLRTKNVSAQSGCGKFVPQRKIPRSKERGIGAGDRGRTGTVSLPSDFESDTSANSITPAHNIMIIAYFFHFVKQTASKFCFYSFVYFQHKTYLTTLDFWRFL